MRGHRPKPLLLTAVSALACESPDNASQTDLVTAFDTVGGVVHVLNEGTPPEWRLVPVVSIGTESLTEEATPQEFGRVSAVALGPDETVFVADAVNHEIRVFGFDGEHVRTFGREGEGPGEFKSIYSVAWVGDRLLVYDPPQGRITDFSAAGERLGERRTAGGMTGSAARLRFYQVGPDEVFRWAVTEGLWVGHFSGGDTGDTVARARAEEDLPGGVEPMFCEGDGAIGYFGAPFASAFIQHPASGGAMYTAWGYTYRIVHAGPAGDTLRVIERSGLAAEPITDEEWTAGHEEYEEFLERFPGAECSPRSFSRPDRKPYIQQIFAASNGWLWVEVVRTAGNRWEFFDREGRLLGGVPVAPVKERSVPVFRGNHLATIRQDSLDLDHVDVWRLELAGEGG